MLPAFVALCVSDSSDDGEELTDAEWEAFWSSLENYPGLERARRRVFAQANELWSDVSPRFNSSEEAFIVVQNGQFRANMAGHVFVSAMANAIAQETVRTMFTDDMLNTLSEELQNQADPEDALQQLSPMNICENCGTEFDPGMNVCPNCGEDV